MTSADRARSERRRRRRGTLPHIGEGSVDKRLDDSVSMRVRFFESFGSTFRATVLNAPRVARVRDELLDGRQQFRAQFEAQFAPELAALSARERSSAVEAGDVLTQMDSLPFSNSGSSKCPRGAV